MDEGLLAEFKKYSDLSYGDDGANTVELYIKGRFEGDCKVYKDAEEDGREYICINNEIIYLDTLKQL